jgi:hypothetical protein
MKPLRWVDQHLWTVPLLVFLLGELALSVWSALSRSPVLLAAAPLAARQSVYTSLTGSSSAILGIALATVAILVAFGPRPGPTGTPTETELDLVRARTIVTGSLLTASLFMLSIVIMATVAEAVDLKPVGNSAITTLIEASGTASVVGLLVGGFGLALVIVERSKQ